MNNEIMKAGYLQVIEEIKSANVSIDRACLIMRAWELPHRVRTATPNVIEYWKDEYGIQGSITK
jgi:hypothetical protein